MDVPQPNNSMPNPLTPALPADATGQAALLLVECLMHHLVEKNVLTREDFIDIVDEAAEVECGEGVELGFPADLSRSILYPIAAAFRKELGR